MLLLTLLLNFCANSFFLGCTTARITARCSGLLYQGAAFLCSVFFCVLLISLFLFSFCFFCCLTGTFLLFQSSPAPYSFASFQATCSTWMLLASWTFVLCCMQWIINSLSFIVYIDGLSKPDLVLLHFALGSILCTRPVLQKKSILSLPLYEAVGNSKRYMFLKCLVQWVNKSKFMLYSTDCWNCDFVVWSLCASLKWNQKVVS